jgi:hypothetical protein
VRFLYAFLVSILVISALQAQDKQEPIRVCVAVPKNSSREIVNTTWQRNQLIKDFERINKGKDVKKGRVAAIRAIPLESTDEADPDVRDKDCRFVLHTNLVEMLQAGERKVSIPSPGAIGIGGPSVGDSRAAPAEYRTATLEYRLTRGGEPEPWASDLVSTDGQSSEDALVSQLMDQVANRVALELQSPHSPSPQ